ncbi:FkbM family methyltransferase [Halotia wernerae UHCC 0503]|nr:FkbM family methyltransferase [Halotia wernerae UHCC 0503]
MNLVKYLLRNLLPHGFVERHRRDSRLNMLGLRSNQYSALELEAAANFCRFELWPTELKYEPQKWTLVDVGANNGNFVAAVLKLVKPLEVIAIEPLPECQDSLRRILLGVQNAQLIPAVAGSKPGTVEINCTKDSKMSSVLQPLDTIETSYETGALTVSSKCCVPVVLLDDVVSTSSTVGLLKIDVQGYEMEVLRGAVRTLSQTLAVQIEINYAPHYVGAVTFEEIHDFLHAAGFRLYGVSAPYFGNHQPLWADALYLHSN